MVFPPGRNAISEVITNALPTILRLSPCTNIGSLTPVESALPTIKEEAADVPENRFGILLKESFAPSKSSPPVTKLPASTILGWLAEVPWVAWLLFPDWSYQVLTCPLDVVWTILKSSIRHSVVLLVEPANKILWFLLPLPAPRLFTNVNECFTHSPPFSLKLICCELLPVVPIFRTRLADPLIALA